jgi:hypothetical protein
MENNLDWYPIQDGSPDLPDFEVPVLVSKLPEGSIKSLVTVARLDSVTKFMSKGEVTRSYRWLDGESGYDDAWYTVIAWKPLPKPYQPNP